MFQNSLARGLYFFFISDPTSPHNVTHIGNIIKFNLANFQAFQNEMSTDDAKMHFHSTIFSYFNYCLTSWFQAGQSVKKNITNPNKKEKPRYYHCCTKK